MSNYCKSCGISIPKNQNTCSVCYGDPHHGKDGYLLNMIEEEYRKQELDRLYEEHLLETEQENDNDSIPLG